MSEPKIYCTIDYREAANECAERREARNDCRA